MTETKHKRTPWEWTSSEGWANGHISSADGHVAVFDAPGDMKFALRACNSHDDLLAACKLAIAELRHLKLVAADDVWVSSEVIEACESAIAKAKP